VIVKIIIYLRVSTDMQVESGLGLQAQRDKCEKFAKEAYPNGEILWFEDGGYSGALALEKRPGLMQAIQSCKKGDILLIATRDRLGRDPFINASVERLVKERGAKIISVTGDRGDEDPTTILMRRIIDAFAEHERLIIASRIKAALGVKKSRGERVGHIPYGYQLAENSNKLVSCQIEQEVLQEMAKLQEKGYSLRLIAKDLNNRDLKNRGKKAWNHSSVHRVIKNVRSQLSLRSRR
jgi:DNA invertase Pin-like site-specific DNA recombinase